MRVQAANVPRLSRLWPHTRSDSRGTPEFPGILLYAHLGNSTTPISYVSGALPIVPFSETALATPFTASVRPEVGLTGCLFVIFAPLGSENSGSTDNPVSVNSADT
jgi:hypothetical protein